MTRFGTVCPAEKFRFDATGGVLSEDGNAVIKPNACGWVTVTFRTTAATLLAGTPPRPVTCKPNVPCAATGPATAPTPVRVSNSRDGVSDTNAPSAVAVAPAISECTV